MLGAEFNVIHNYLYNAIEGTRYGLLVGGRFMSLCEKLLMEQVRNQLPDVTGVSITEGITENFTTYNRFYGGQVGGVIETCLGRLQVQFITKVAMGVTNQTVKINGGDTLILPANPALGLPNTTIIQSPYTLFVGPGNTGTHTRSEFTVIPEGQVNGGWMFNENVMLTFGYTFMWWSDVMRPGDQIDRVVNIQPVGDLTPILPLQPRYLGHARSLWVQGLQVGLMLNF
jgi:hypothetical protein